MLEGWDLNQSLTLCYWTKVADVWSCGVTLYVMLVGAYPFEDPDEPKNFRKTIQVSFADVFTSAFLNWLPILIKHWQDLFCRGYWVCSTRFQTMSTYLQNAKILFLGFLSPTQPLWVLSASSVSLVSAHVCFEHITDIPYTEDHHPWDKKSSLVLEELPSWPNGW